MFLKLALLLTTSRKQAGQRYPMLHSPPHRQFIRETASELQHKPTLPPRTYVNPAKLTARALVPKGFMKVPLYFVVMGREIQGKNG